jgi:hypothetical protein
VIYLKGLPPLIIVLLCFGPSKAIPITDYHQNVEQAIENLRGMTGAEHEDFPTVQLTLNSVRTLLPLRLNVEWGESNYSVDNTWLHQLLGELEKASASDRSIIQNQITERLEAVSERLSEIEHGLRVSSSEKVQSRKKLEEILARSEYAQKPEETSALARLWIRFLKWLSSLFGPPKAIQPGSANAISKVSQVLVVVLALAVIAYVLWIFVPRFRRLRRPRKKKSKPQPRVVLGERLAPDQSAVDLLSEAEALARKGEIRMAIRKGYIALLVELGDRKLISLAQHKTNRDYLRSLRERQSLHGKMALLTDSFERHWYGLARATDNDWAEFRSRYRETLQE